MGGTVGYCRDSTLCYLSPPPRVTCPHSRKAILPTSCDSGVVGAGNRTVSRAGPSQLSSKAAVWDLCSEDQRSGMTVSQDGGGWTVSRETRIVTPVPSPVPRPGPPGALPLHDEDLRLGGVQRAAVAQLAQQRVVLQRRLRALHVAGAARGLRRPGRRLRLVEDPRQGGGCPTAVVQPLSSRATRKEGESLKIAPDV